MKRLSTLFIASLLLSSAALAADATAGKASYDKSCKSCHGATGAPNPGIAKSMKVEMKDLGSAEVQALSDADLKKAITNGMGKMKPIAAVSGSAADDVVAYVRTFKK
jgi:mono/diheme cytochrome c family protein